MQPAYRVGGREGVDKRGIAVIEFFDHVHITHQQLLVHIIEGHVRGGYPRNERGHAAVRILIFINSAIAVRDKIFIAAHLHHRKYFTRGKIDRAPETVRTYLVDLNYSLVAVIAESKNIVAVLCEESNHILVQDAFLETCSTGRIVQYDLFYGAAHRFRFRHQINIVTKSVNGIDRKSVV